MEKSICLCSKVSSPALVPNQLPIKWKERDLSWKVVRPGHEAGYLPPHNVKTENEWTYTSTPPVPARLAEEQVYFIVSNAN
jgi:hypothetical protein